MSEFQANNISNIDMAKIEPSVPQSISNNSTSSTFSSGPISHLQTQSKPHQQYALKWNDFQSSILKSFQHLRDEEDFVDVTLACDEKSFFAHKVVLSACSPYFRKLLKANPCEHPIIILRDVYPDDMDSLLCFMYKGEVSVSHTNLPEFLKTAQMLQIRGLTDVTSNLSTPGINTCETKSPTSINDKSEFQLESENSKKGILPLSTTLTLGCVPQAAKKITGFASCSNSNQSNCTNSVRTKTSTFNTPPLQEYNKASLVSPRNSLIQACQQWDLGDSDERNNHITPPPQKRIKSADLFRAQHGISPERLLIDIDNPVAGQHPLTRERKDRSREACRDRDRSAELREALSNQILEKSSALGVQKNYMDSELSRPESDGEDTDSNDIEPADQGDGQQDTTQDGTNGSLDNTRSHTFSNAFLGIQGLLSAPSNISGNEFVTRRSLEMRVRATDPRPCPKCGKIYRSAHTLRTHLEDKHTICPGYRCVLCGTVAKSRNSLHSHMSRQHRGISTKDLPVLPMPSAFDPELASRLLAKAGVTISAAELRARASPTNSNGGGSNLAENQQKMNLDCDDSKKDELEDSDDDPEDLTTGNNGLSIANNELNLLNLGRSHIARAPSTGQPLLDLQLLQLITESTFGMSMAQEHAAAAALHAAKMVQLNAMGQDMENLSPKFEAGIPTSDNSSNINYIESKSRIDNRSSCSAKDNVLSILAETTAASSGADTALETVNTSSNTANKTDTVYPEPDEDYLQKRHQEMNYTQK